MNFGGTLRLNKFACFTLGFILFLIIYWRTGGINYPIEKSDLINLKSLLKAAIQAAERGGKLVKQGHSQELKIKSKGKTLEGVNDPVTAADYASHCAMYFGLKNTFSKLTVVSEEFVEFKGTKCEDQPVIDVETFSNDPSIEYMNDELVYVKDITVWIDPLDATKEYTEGLYQYVTTMVCVAIRGVPIIGVIHNPFTAHTYWGWYTKKHSMNIPLVEHREQNKQAPTVIVSQSHAGEGINIAKEAFGENTIVKSAAGAGYKVIAVANGTADVYLHSTVIKKWDLCAGDAILKSLNGKMTTTTGEYINYSAYSGAIVRDGILATRFDHDYYRDKLAAVKQRD